jgi:hypothetical protein
MKNENKCVKNKKEIESFLIKKKYLCSAHHGNSKISKALN